MGLGENNLCLQGEAKGKSWLPGGVVWGLKTWGEGGELEDKADWDQGVH